MLDLQKCHQKLQMKSVYNESNFDTSDAAYFYNHKCIKCVNGLKTIVAENKRAEIPQEQN